jgi:hypothetical protein
VSYPATVRHLSDAFVRSPPISVRGIKQQKPGRRWLTALGLPPYRWDSAADPTTLYPLLITMNDWKVNRSSFDKEPNARAVRERRRMYDDFEPSRIAQYSRSITARSRVCSMTCYRVVSTPSTKSAAPYAARPLPPTFGNFACGDSAGWSGLIILRISLRVSVP